MSGTSMKKMVMFGKPKLTIYFIILTKPLTIMMSNSLTLSLKLTLSFLPPSLSLFPTKLRMALSKSLGFSSPIVMSEELSNGIVIASELSSFYSKTRNPMASTYRRQGLVIYRLSL